MNVASLELCKELYDLSGWEVSAGFYWYTLYPDHEVAYYKPMYNAKFSEWTEQCPAYDLGYLLRKLPPVIQEDKKFLALQVNAQGDGTWNMAYTEPYDKEFFGWHITSATTPEDAACKLAIELFKQGVLEKADG